MDNYDYLHKISAKPTSPSSRTFSPLMIRFIIIASAIVALIITLSIIIGNVTGQTKALYESLHLRLNNLSSDVGPIASYTRELKSSQLRALAGTLRSALTVANQDLAGLLPELKIDPTSIRTATVDSEFTILSEYNQTLRDAQLNGLLDRTFVSSTSLQIALIIALSTEILEHNPPDYIRTVIDQLMTDLTRIETGFANFNNGSS